MSFALRPGKFTIGRLLAAVGMPQSAVFPSGVMTPHQRVTLGPMFHDDLESWRWFVRMGFDQRGESVSCDLSDEERSRIVGFSKSVGGVNDISINVLDLPGMLMGA